MVKGVKVVSKYTTTDGHEFVHLDDANKWQAYLNAKELEKVDAINRESWCQKIYNKDELRIMLEYLNLYLGFSKVFDDYSKLQYPIQVVYNINTKTFKIVEEVI